MATYKVPQDVEAEDKLLGPFTFRQFIYLMVIFGCVLLAIALFQIFPLLAVIPLPFIIFFGILALPIKKDQPMETYLAAILQFHTKPNRRFWVPGQSESTILITAPKIKEPSRKRNISEDEASHRLSFLSEIVDSEGHAIKNASTTMKDDFYAEAYNTTDMFERDSNFGIGNRIAKQEEERRAEVINQMRNALDNPEAYNYSNPDELSVASSPTEIAGRRTLQPTTAPQFYQESAIIQPGAPAQPIYSTPDTNTVPPAPALNERGETAQQESDRIRKENEGEIYVSLH